MRDHQHEAAILDGPHPLAEGCERRFPVHMTLEEGIETVMRRERAHVHLARGVLAPAPAAAENDIRCYPVLLHVVADGTGLCAADVIQIALRGAVVDPEMRRVPETGGQRVSQEQDIRVDPGYGLAKRFGPGR